jgi:hypothetical protein
VSEINPAGEQLVENVWKVFIAAEETGSPEKNRH